MFMFGTKHFWNSHFLVEVMLHMKKLSQYKWLSLLSGAKTFWKMYSLRVFTKKFIYAVDAKLVWIPRNRSKWSLLFLFIHFSIPGKFHHGTRQFFCQLCRTPCETGFKTELFVNYKLLTQARLFITDVLFETYRRFTLLYSLIKSKLM